MCDYCDVGMVFRKTVAFSRGTGVFFDTKTIPGLKFSLLFRFIATSIPIRMEILQYAVILLGFGMNFSVVASTGMCSLPIIISTIIVSRLVAYLLSKFFRTPDKITILIGVGSSICGGSAIAAAAPVINANDEEISQSISVIFLFNVIAALVFPTLGRMP